MLVEPHVRFQVLLVEEDSIIREELACGLASRGYAVRAVGTFAEGKDALASHPPDLLIAGVRLGAYNGLHLIIRARAQRPTLPAILTTPIADPALAVEAERCGALYCADPLSALSELVVALLQAPR